MDGSSTSRTRGFTTRAREISKSRRSPPERTRAGWCRRFASRWSFRKLGSAAARRGAPSMRPQVRVEDALVALDLLGLALRQQLSVRQAIDVLGQLHDDAHVVLDDEQRDPELAIGLAEPLQQAVDQRRID